jgi:hypothetical protein
MNPYSENFDVIDLGNSTSSEEVLKQIPSSRLVKAFNTMYYEHLRTKGNPNASREDRSAIFVAGDNSDAKAIVSKLIIDGNDNRRNFVSFPIRPFAFGAPFLNWSIFTVDSIDPFIATVNTLVFVNLNFQDWHLYIITNGVRH